MMDFLKSIFSPDDFMPHGHCYLWTWSLVWLHVISDTLIGLAYLSIPVTLVYFVRKRRDIPFNWMFFAFGVFILACGATHFMEVWNVWHAAYWLAGAIKALTATASILTAVLLVKLIPQALTLPSRDVLQKARDELEFQVQERTAELLQTTKDLETEITERKQAEETLGASEVRYRRLFEAARDGILVLDAETGMVVDVNPFLVELLGYSREVFLGKKVWELGFFKDILANQNNFTELQQKGYVRYEDKPLETSDGRRVDVEFVSNVYQAGDGKVIQCNIRDIRGRKHAQDESRRLNVELEERVAARTAELATTNKELEAFCYSVSHDLRGPLRGLDGFSQALVEDYGDKLDNEGRNLLQRIRAGSQRMGQLIDDLLSLSRVSRNELRREPVDLSELAGDIADELRSHDPQRDVALRISEGLMADGDPHLLRMVLENLLGNAWKYTSKRPHATIEFGLSRVNGHSSFYVRDDGAGFDMQYADKLFTPFQRLHKMNEFPGTGIGLATVQRIIHRHGGRVWAQAEVNKGATFHFTLS